MRDGFTATPGSTIDYDFIYEDMKNHLDSCKAVIYDPWKAKHLLKDLKITDMKIIFH